MSRILIVSTDPPTATLLGAFAQVEGYEVMIHDDVTETPAAAIARTHPHIILVDIDHPDAFGPAVLGQLRAEGIPAAAFSPGRLTSEVREKAEPYGLPTITLPIEAATFAAVLRRLVR
jgi:DNA-binding response OmpR family regulator